MCVLHRQVTGRLWSLWCVALRGVHTRGPQEAMLTAPLGTGPAPGPRDTCSGAYGACKCDALVRMFSLLT